MVPMIIVDLIIKFRIHLVVETVIGMLQTAHLQRTCHGDAHYVRRNLETPNYVAGVTGQDFRDKLLKYP